jgi:UDP-N-acetylbacillosamine transaminase
MHKQPLFKDSQAVVNGVSEELFERGICLPSGTALEDSQVVRISDIIKEALDV